MSLHVDSRRENARAGRMTSIMRAAAMPASPKALRVAVVHEGRIVDERIFRDGERALDVIDDVSLFATERGARVLCVPSGATGHIVSDSGRVTIGPQAMRIPLDESARGKLVIGSATVLFQFVIPPPRPSRPQLPLATKRGEVDWMLTILVGVSFLLHFGFIGTMFSDWADPAVSQDGVAIGLIDMTTKLPPALVEDRTNDPNATPTSSDRTKENPSAHANTSEHARTSANDAASLAREGESMRMTLLAAFGGASAVEGALRRGDVPIADLDQVARSDQGATSTGGDLRLATNGGATTPGAHVLSELGVGHGNETRAGHERQVTGPKFEMDVQGRDGPGVTGGLEAAIARLRPSFRSCYVRKGLDVDPTMEGQMTLEFRVAPNGDLTDVVKLDGSGLSPAVEQCIIARAHNATFSASGGGSRARVPVIFKQQH